jgi:polysaccharide export outer membrane protein
MMEINKLIKNIWKRTFATILFGITVATAVAQPSPDYKIAPLDRLTIDVFNEPQFLQRDLMVSGEGKIIFPLLNEVEVAGLTVSQAKAKLEQLLGRDYLVEPHVTIMIQKYRVRSVTVLGAVKLPGPYDLPEEQQIGLLEAIARAGGFTRQARKSRILVKREGEEEIRVFSEQQILASKNPREFFTIKDGDIIKVKESFF